jgi:hypothetical protein
MSGSETCFSHNRLLHGGLRSRGEKQTATCRRFTGTVRKNTSFALITARQPRRVALTSMHLFVLLWGTQTREKQVMLTRGCVSVVEVLTVQAVFS